MKTYSVSEINNYIKGIIDNDFLLYKVRIKGEVFNLNKHHTGHMFFSLKDEESRIKTVMFKSDALKIDFELEEGMNILAKGNISVYERDGTYQFYVKTMEKLEDGILSKEFKELREKLEKQGLFDSKHKKKIPDMPKTIGVVTSPTGAAIKDIITVIKRRFPPTNIIIYPSLVQGNMAVENIMEGLNYLDSLSDIDLIIFGRGGGATEELSCFNDERLIKTIFNLKTPSISAIGHEIDFTLSDFVADLRAATPSAAAEIAVPDIIEYKKNLRSIFDHIEKEIKTTIINEKNSLKYMAINIKLKNPEIRIRDEYQGIISRMDKIEAIITDKLKKTSFDLREIDLKIKSLNPSNILKKGYSIIENLEGEIISSVKDLEGVDTVKVNFNEDSILLRIKKVGE